MRIMLSIDDDVLIAVKRIAALQRKSIGGIISSLARQSLHVTATNFQTRNGVPLLKVCKGSPRVTSELVRRLGEKLL